MALPGMDLNSVVNFAAPLLGGGMQALNGAGGAGGTNQAGGAQAGMGLAMQMMPQAMQIMQMVMQAVTMMGSQMGVAGGGTPSFGGAGGMTPGIGDFLGGAGGGGGGGGFTASPASFGGGGGASPMSTGDISSSLGGGSGDSAKAVEIARQYMGQRTGGIQGLPGFTRNGQDDNNCAEFVSACLDKAGTYKKQPGDASVATLAQNLQKQGWKKVSKEQTKPGDVAVFNKSQHVELVSQPGGKELIGSNNKGNVQYVGTDQGNWGNIEYYSKG